MFIFVIYKKEISVHNIGVLYIYIRDLSNSNSKPQALYTTGFIIIL